MTRRCSLVHRMAARRRLLELAEDLAPFFSRESLDVLVRARAPELVRVVGEREIAAVIELAARPLQGEGASISRC